MRAFFELMCIFGTSKLSVCAGKNAQASAHGRASCSKTCTGKRFRLHFQDTYLSSLPTNILLLHILLPPVLIAMGGLFIDHRWHYRWTVMMSVIVTITSALIVSFSWSKVIELRIPIKLGEQTTLFNELVWRVDSLSRFSLILLPCGLWASLLRLDHKSISAQPLWLIGIHSALSIATLADDLASVATGLALTILMITIHLRPQQQVADYRHSTLSQSTLNWSSWMLAGLCLWVSGVILSSAVAAVVSSAPFGVPSSTTTQIEGLNQFIKSAHQQHPAARLVWDQIEAVPYFIQLTGLLMLTGLFPFHQSMQQLANQNHAGAAWVLVWPKLILLISIRSLTSWRTINNVSETQELTFWLLCFVFLGVVYSASASLIKNGFQGRMSVWTTQIAWLVLLAGSELNLGYLILAQGVGLLLVLRNSENIFWLSVASASFIMVPLLTGDSLWQLMLTLSNISLIGLMLNSMLIVSLICVTTSCLRQYQKVLN